jgi:NAD(P)-dependent dehydrogenase (short-subunit alcohol dehydrogenase family)
MRLDGRVAIVTGGGFGIGEAISRRLADEGAIVVIAERNTPEGERVAAAVRTDGGRRVTFEPMYPMWRKSRHASRRRCAFMGGSMCW